VVTDNGGTAVSDQEYTAMFVFGYAGETAQSVLENIVSKCRMYSKIPRDVTVYREAAAIQIGLVPNAGPHTLIKKRDGHVTTVQIDCFKVKSAPSWSYTTFRYVLKDDEFFGLEPTSISYSYQEQRKKRGNDGDSVQCGTKHLRLSSSLSPSCVEPETTAETNRLQTVRAEMPSTEKKNKLISVPTVQPSSLHTREKNVPVNVQQTK